MAKFLLPVLLLCLMSGAAIGRTPQHQPGESKDARQGATNAGAPPAAAAAACSPYADWTPWTEKCTRWTSLAEMRNDFAAACRVPVNGSHDEPDLGFKMPRNCGHCSVRIRCRKRPGSTAKGCFPLDPQTETCHEYGDVCTTDKHPEFGCRWNTLSVGLKNCADQPHFSDHRRDSLRRFANAMPDMNCFEKDGQCKCCCHPFKPNKEGTECVKIHEEPKCDALGDYNQWSKCLWYPLMNVTQEVRSHCHLGVHTNEVLLPKPTGMELPEPCGHCSFKVRCKTRPRKDGCFHIESDKKPCGPEECPTCSDVCSVPKIDDQCDWEKIVGKTSSHKEEAIFSAMPYWRLRGINKLRELPRGVCKDINGQCKCCCHPFEPNEDGTKCVPTGMCSV